MAPYATTRTRPTATNPRRKPRRINYKDKKMKSKKSATPPASVTAKENLALSISSLTCSSNTCLNVDGDGLEGVDASTMGICSTPKAQRFRIPEVTTCPRAPKKPRMAPNCSIQRTRPIAFFAHPDLEVFFFYALRDIPG